MSATSYTSTKYCLLFVVKKLFSTVFAGSSVHIKNKVLHIISLFCTKCKSIFKVSLFCTKRNVDLTTLSDIKIFLP